jgi:hypothetical protein
VELDLIKGSPVVFKPHNAPTDDASGGSGRFAGDARKTPDPAKGCRWPREVVPTGHGQNGASKADARPLLENRRLERNPFKPTHPFFVMALVRATHDHRL